MIDRVTYGKAISLTVSFFLALSIIVSGQPIKNGSNNSRDSLPFNPIIRNKFTADPAAMVFNNAVYLYTGHDEAPPGQARYIMHDWLCFSSTDMINWKEQPSPLNVKDFTWAKDDAWASQVVYRNNKFYWYVAITHGTIPGKAIGVAVSDNPTGLFKDALGKALITNDMTTATKISWDDIDPSVIIDDDGQAYLFWGNTKCYYAWLVLFIICLSVSRKDCLRYESQY